MGLDMYAYTIDARLVEGEGEIEVELHDIARRAVGFVRLYDFEVNKLDPAGQAQYWKKERESLEKAKEEGWIDTEFAYWRKFNNLHAWMEALYRSKGGAGDFNCATVRLDLEDLNKLENDAPNLSPASGFFWGASEEMDQDSIAEVKAFVARARAAIAEGKAVFYDSWW